MRIKNTFVLQKVGSADILVAVGENADFHGVIHCNRTAAFIVTQLQRNSSKEELCQSLMNQYSIDISKADEAVEYVLNQLRYANALEED